MQSNRKARILELCKQANAVNPVTGAVAKTVAKPIEGIGDMFLSALVGRKATSGVMKGKRLQSAGMKTISPTEYGRLQGQRAAGQEFVPGVSKTKTPSGKTIYQKEHYRRGGAVGLAQKHPFWTAAILGGGGLYAHHRLSNRGGVNQYQNANPAPSMQDTPWGTK